MKTSNTQFRVASENISDIALILIEKEYEELDPCVPEFEEGSKILIDTERKTYYFLDEECLQSSKEIVQDKYNTTIEPVDFDEVKNWV